MAASETVANTVTTTFKDERIGRRDAEQQRTE
jgi:hypothetical protein